MLDNETKRRIDTARDVLVGKVPDPKSQVEQITIALIYKFMDDMDKEAVEMGGKAGFFAGDYQKYAWSKIFAPQLGGFEMLALYADAITRMAQNPNLPQLFRDIFKNAYLPYRDPETLKLFLKMINEFSYDHSERLGDAFEYLLSVLGSQGDAGQFRTPRHIIDFMVQVVAPQKKDIILDPACGTAGFLISSFKYILKENTRKTPGDKLTTDERKKLLTNFKGYDISPDMVRLSLVNLYLHGFVQPQVLEYDTLSSEDRWNEYADVIMANPPFMSPKGGIKPHKKFSVQSNRSEVLFVDYIAEHLRPTGRAAVIVPEGIIFQSAGAYKQLRKMLVDKYLYAVVSLPAGVFNPYSGVKTSILFLDVQLARKTDAILFVKIENDGFGLGAQRREIAGNDLPDATKILTDYIKAARYGALNAFAPEGKPCCALLVKKETLAENGEYNLTGERYRVTKRKVNQKWPMVKLGDVCELNPKKSEVKDLPSDTSISFVPMEDLNANRISFAPKKEKTLGDVIKSYTYFKDNDVLLARVTPCFENGKAGIAQGLMNGIGFGSSEYYVIRPSSIILPEFVYRLISTDKFRINGAKLMTGTGGLQRVPVDYLYSYAFPLPSLEVQREIVAEIEGYQKLIDGARQVVENWKPQIDIDPQWPMVKLGKVCDITSSKRIFQGEYVSSGIPFYRTKEIVELSQGKEISLEFFISKNRFEEINEKFGVPEKNDILISAVGTIGVSWIVSDERQFYFKDGNLLWMRKFSNADVQFIKIILDTNISQNLHLLTNGAAYNALTIIKLKDLSIPLPHIDVQREIVAKIEAERKAVDGCRELIDIYETKIKQVIDKVWED